MKQNLIATLLVLGLAAAPAEAADIEGQAGAKIVAPLNVTKDTDLYFGTIAPSQTESGRVRISPLGNKRCDAALTCLTDDHTSAKFSVTGTDSTFYTITVPDSIQITNGSGGSMTVSDFTPSKSRGFLRRGSDEFRVGAILDVEARQAVGEYTGAFTVTVEYQ